MIKLSQRIEKESLILYDKIAYIPCKHNDILEIASEIGTKTINK